MSFPALSRDMSFIKMSVCFSAIMCCNLLILGGARLWDEYPGHRRWFWWKWGTVRQGSAFCCTFFKGGVCRIELVVDWIGYFKFKILERGFVFPRQPLLLKIMHTQVARLTEERLKLTILVSRLRTKSMSNVKINAANMQNSFQSHLLCKFAWGGKTFSE